MFWLCLLPPLSLQAPAAGTDQLAIAADGADRQRQAAWQLLRFTPRVAVLEEAVVAEVSGCERLFSGFDNLIAQVKSCSVATGFGLLGAGGSAQAALVRARWLQATASPAGAPPDPAVALSPAVASGPAAASGPAVASGPPESLSAPELDELPLVTLSAARTHLAMLARAGFCTLGSLRALPRGPLARRFGAPLLHALDQTYGLKPEVFDWISLPEVFDERLELPGRVDTAPQLLFAATRLLERLHTWLAARRAGVKTIELRWKHDFAARSAGEGGALCIRTALAARDVQHLTRLLRERLNQTTLNGPVGEIALKAVDVEPLVEDSASFLPDPKAQGEGLQQLLERLSARLGPQRVLMPQLQNDWRIEHAQRWEPAESSKSLINGKNSANVQYPQHFIATQNIANLPNPSFILLEPLPLLVQHHKPFYQGPLTLLAGPERVEAVWWASSAGDGAPAATTARDYFLAHSPVAGLLWIFKQRLPAHHQTRDIFQWALHGIFA